MYVITLEGSNDEQMRISLGCFLQLIHSILTSNQASRTYEKKEDRTVAMLQIFLVYEYTRHRQEKQRKAMMTLIADISHPSRLFLDILARGRNRYLLQLIFQNARHYFFSAASF